MDVDTRLDDKDILYLKGKYKQIDLSFTDEVIMDHLRRYRIDRIDRAFSQFEKYDTGEISNRESYFVKILINLGDEDIESPAPVEETRLQKDLRYIRQKVRELVKDNDPIAICMIIQDMFLKNFRKAWKDNNTARLSHLFRLEHYVEKIIHEETGRDVSSFYYTLNENIKELVKLISEIVCND